MRLVQWSWQLLGGWLLLAGCGSVEVPDARRYVIETWGESLLRDNYGKMREQSALLSRRAEAFVDSPDNTSLRELQASWLAVRAPWKRAEIFGFGPNINLPERFVARIDFWPVRPLDVEDAVAKGKGSSSQALGASERGLPAIEYLLFNPAAEEQLTNDKERRRYLSRATRELDEATHEVFSAWDPHNGGYYQELIDAGRGSQTYASLHVALQEMVRQAVFLLDRVQKAKLAAPLGTTGTPAPELVESPSSERALDDLRDNLKCIEVFYFGEGPWQGLEWYLANRGKSRAVAVQQALDDTREALDAIETPLQTAVVEEPKRVQAAITKVQALQRVFEVDIVNALSLSVGYTPNDSD